MKDNVKKQTLGAQVAPAVALLLLGGDAAADADSDCVVDLDSSPCASVPEPSALSLFAAGAIAVGVTHAIKKWRE